MSPNTPYETQIIGKENIPPKRQGKFVYLANFAKQLKEGECIRLVIPKTDIAATVGA